MGQLGKRWKTHQTSMSELEQKRHFVKLIEVRFALWPPSKRAKDQGLLRNLRQLQADLAVVDNLTLVSPTTPKVVTAAFP